MTKEKAEYIKKLRLKYKFDFRTLAKMIHKKYNCNWHPKDDVDIGRMLYEASSDFLSQI